MNTPAALVACSLLPLLVACSRAPEAPARPPADNVPPSNRVDIGPAVRQNLGLTFATVERRAVARTLRIPGRFEFLPGARREYRTPSGARVEVLVRQFQRVQPGDPLYRLDSPRWRDLQRELADAEAAVALARAAADSIGPYKNAHEQHHAQINQTVELWAERVRTLEQLRAAGAARGDEVAQALASLSAARASLAETLEKEADLTAREREAGAQLAAATARQSAVVQTALSFLGRTSSPDLMIEGGRAFWRTIDRVEVLALTPGVVQSINAAGEGALIPADDLVLTTVQPEMVRFHAHALQSDLGRIAPGMPAAAVAPAGGSLAASPPVSGSITLAPAADADRRTIEVVMTPDPARPIPDWARAGVAGFLEIVTAGAGDEELAIPIACVVRDGAQSIIFRRDPADPDKVIRLVADLGIDDGRWTVIHSGVAEGNQIVLDGAYQLMAATSGSIPKGGHFHPDGTFHEAHD